MIFDAEEIIGMIETYLYEVETGRNPAVLEMVEHIYEQVQEANFDFMHGEVDRVLNSFQICVDSEDTRANIKDVKGVKREDVAFISMHYGFLYGLVYAENKRLKFWSGLYG